MQGLKRIQKYEFGNRLNAKHVMRTWEHLTPVVKKETPEDNQSRLYEALITAIEPHIGTPYLWGGKSWNQGGVDCSGFTDLIYTQLGVNLSGGSMNQFNNDTTKVELQDAKVGDLVFLKGTIADRGPEGISHVGIFLGANPDGTIKVAESCSKGVSINDWNLKKGYHAKHFAGIRRIKQEKLG